MQLWSGPSIYMFDASKGYISHFFIWFEQTISSDLEQPGTPQNEVWFLNMTCFSFSETYQATLFALLLQVLQD